MNVLFLVSKCECKTQLVILLYKYDNGDFKDRKTISKSLSFIYKENSVNTGMHQGNTIQEKLWNKEERNIANQNDLKGKKFNTVFRGLVHSWLLVSQIINTIISITN